MHNKTVPSNFQHYTNVTRILCRRFVYQNLPELDFYSCDLPLSLVCLLRAQGGRLVISVAAFCSSYQIWDFRRWYKSLSSLDSTMTAICMWCGKLLARVWRSRKSTLQSGCTAVTGCSDLRLCPIWPWKYHNYFILGHDRFLPHLLQSVSRF